jgi:hypothetical protein
MFYIGSNVMDWPLQAQRALADGHQICVREPHIPILSARMLMASFIFLQTHGLIDT